MRGDFVTAPPRDHFDATAGIALEVADGGRVDQRAAWTSAECVTATNGRIGCQSADRLARAKFKARGPSFRFAARLRRRALVAPFQAPVRVRITHGEMIDRVGTVGGCTSTGSAMRCRQ